MMYKVIIFFVVIFNLASGHIQWILKDKPAVFGTDIQIVCSLPNDVPCCRKYNRQWNVGSNYTLTIMNDKSLNKNKYCEELDEYNRKSVLTIKSFSVEDVNIPYECVYGFQKYGATLELTTAGYEFHPKQQLPLKPTVINHTIHLNATFPLIYPVPVCTAMIGLNNISSELNVSFTHHTLLYMSTITLDYTMSPRECGNSLVVTCLVGQTVLTVTDVIPCSHDAVHAGSPLIAIALGIAGTLAFAILIMVVFCKRRRHDDSNRQAVQKDRYPIPFSCESINTRKHYSVRVL